jgi:hypothetical protein
MGKWRTVLSSPGREVTPPAELDGSLDQVLASVDTLRMAWEAFAASVSAEDFAEARQRSLRRHAIETGIIERLYDVEWGVTEALVAEGLTLEVAERQGGIDEDALARGFVDRLRGVKLGTDEARAAAVMAVAEDVQRRVEEQLAAQAKELRSAFQEVDPSDASREAISRDHNDRYPYKPEREYRVSPRRSGALGRSLVAAIPKGAGG